VFQDFCVSTIECSVLRHGRPQIHAFAALIYPARAANCPLLPLSLLGLVAWCRLLHGDAPRLYSTPSVSNFTVFSYFQRKLTIPQTFFDWISTYRRVHTRRIAFYRRLLLPTYPPEMNGTAAWATDCTPTNGCDGLYGVHCCHDSTPQRPAATDDPGLIPLPPSLAILSSQNRKLSSPATLPPLSSCSGSFPAW
jgi:hypothetical protein